MKLTRRLALIFGLVALAMAIPALAAWKIDRSYVARCDRTIGRVITVEAVNFSRGKRALIEFEAGGKSVRFHEAVGSSIPSRSPGERIEVLYDRANPANAMVDSFWNHNLLIVIFGIIGGGFALASAILALLSAFK